MDHFAFFADLKQRDSPWTKMAYFQNEKIIRPSLIPFAYLVTLPISFTVFFGHFGFHWNISLSYLENVGDVSWWYVTVISLLVKEMSKRLSNIFCSLAFEFLSIQSLLGHWKCFIFLWFNLFWWQLLYNMIKPQNNTRNVFAANRLWLCLMSS